MKYFIVNTNRKKDNEGHDEAVMLNEEIVALYFDGYKQKLVSLRQVTWYFYIPIP